VSFLRKNYLILAGLGLIAVSVFIRLKIIGLTNEDMALLEDWYGHFYRNGIRDLANGRFSNYSPFYLYFLWLVRTQSDWLSRSIGIKLIPTAFDLVSALAIFLLSHIKFRTDRSFFNSAIFFTLPTVMFLSTGWGQIESMYTCFLLLCVYFLLKEKPLYALVMYGLAFSVKSQSVFLLPFLGILFLKGKINWYHFLLIPGIYIVLAIPAAFFGRSWQSIFMIYIGQVGQFHLLSMNAPNLYIFVPETYYDVGVWIGIGIFLVAMGVWGWVSWRAQMEFTPRQIMLMALSILVLVPFTLPKMHDRYFYMADVFSFAAIIFVPEMWFVPILYQLISLLSYTVFILNTQNTYVMIAAIINTGVVGYILYKYFANIKNPSLE
jgi:Gpi18-like mannosyltransferase